MRTIHRASLVVMAAGALASVVACGGGSSGTSGPSAVPTPDNALAAGTVLSLVSGETGQPVPGANVVVSGRPYMADGSGQVTLSDSTPYGSLLDVTSPNFLDRQTLIRKGASRRLVLWPRTTASGIDENYTSQLIYTAGTADAPPSGSSPLERIQRGATQAVLVISEELRQSDKGNEFHQLAVANINAALAGRFVYALSPTTPASGIVFTAAVDGKDAVCQDGDVLGYAQVRTQSGEITGGKIVYCRLDELRVRTVTHELGHTVGLNHAGGYNEVMAPYIYNLDIPFTAREALSMNLLFERPGGNLFPDNDRSVTTAGPSTRTVICRAQRAPRR